MLPYLENTGNIIPGIVTYKRCPLNELLRSPVAFKLVMGCQVIFICGISVEFKIACMRCYAIITVINFHTILSVKNGNLLSNITIRNTVIMLVFSKTYMVVFHYRNYFLPFSLVPVLWQWLQIRFFYFFKQLSSAIGTTGQQLVVVILKCFSDSSI